MKKSERILSALVTMMLGVLLVVWQSDIINVLMSVLGISLAVLAVLDFVCGKIKLAMLKLVGGILCVAFGWLLISVVSYVLATSCILFALYLTIDFFRRGNRLACNLFSVSLCLKPVLLVLMGVFLFLNNGGEAGWAFVLTGVFTAILGGTLLLDVFACD